MIGSLLSGNAGLTDIIISLLLRIPAVLIAISVHEAAHAYIAYKLGDPTAKLMGRVTINPIAHFDLFGSICMLIFGFGWAKPVPFDLRMLKRPKRDIALVAAAGPVSNFIVGFIFTGLWMGLLIAAMLMRPQWLADGSVFDILLQMLQIIAVLNISLMVFNLIPIPPLDGSKVLISLLPTSAHRFVLRYERYGMSILMIWLLISDYLPWFLSIDYLLSWVVGHIFDFIYTIWDLIFSLFV